MNILLKNLSPSTISTMRSLFSGHTGYLILLIVAPLPFLYFLFHFVTQLLFYENVACEIERIHKKSSQIQLLHEKEGALLASLKNSDHFYLDKHIETLCFLESDIKKMEAQLVENPNDDTIKKRLSFLKEGPNRLLFSEIQTRRSNTIQEVEEKQQHPVEMNEEDLKRTLSLVEGVTIWPYGPKEMRPQLIIKDFQLSRKENGSQEFVYVVNMDLLKRESLTP